MDHEKSQQAREFLRSYVNGNRKLITVWLDGSGNAEDVGSHLLCIMLERLAIDEKPDLSGIAGGHVIKLFQTVPRRVLAPHRWPGQSGPNRHSIPILTLSFAIIPIVPNVR